VLAECCAVMCFQAHILFETIRPPSSAGVHRSAALSQDGKFGKPLNRDSVVYIKAFSYFSSLVYI